MKRLLLVGLVAGAFALSSCGAASPYAAKVKLPGRPEGVISQRELDRELEAILDNEPYLERIEQGFAGQGQAVKGKGARTLDTVFVARVLERRIQFELVHLEADRRKLKPGGDDLRLARNELIASFGDREMFEAFPDGYQDDLVRATAEANILQGVTSASVRAYYEEHPDQFSQTCVRHILSENQESAAKVKARLAAGEDFAAVARAESKDPGSGARGGDLGCQTRGNFVPEFETAMDGLQPGQTSDPVQSQFGFHVIQVVSRRPTPYSDAVPEARQRLQQETQAQASEIIGQAIEKARIRVNPRYGRFIRSAEFLGIKAPKELGATTTTVPVSGPAPPSAPTTAPR